MLQGGVEVPVIALGVVAMVAWVVAMVVRVVGMVVSLDIVVAIVVTAKTQNYLANREDSSAIDFHALIRTWRSLLAKTYLYTRIASYIFIF